MVFAWTSVQADDLKIADDFKSGDLVSADTFNQIFDTIEKINRTVVDADLVGVWSCTSIYSGSNSQSGWSDKTVYRVLAGSQVNFVASSATTSEESPYSISTSTPNPISQNSSSDQASSFAGTYILRDNNIWIKHGSLSKTYRYDVDIVSPTKFIASLAQGGATSLQQLIDPVQGAVAFVAVRTSGNEDLKPEESTAYNIGFSYEPFRDFCIN